MLNQGYQTGYQQGGHQQGGMGSNFNRWCNTGLNYQAMDGFNMVDYSKGWDTNIHDQMLKDNIDYAFNKYDTNFSGQLQGNQFFYAYRQLCLRMGLCPPQSYQDVWNAVMAGDTNFDKRVSKKEMFALFKRVQNINAGIMGFGGQQGMGSNYNANMGSW